uniref:Uncharacterized protein C9orf85 (Trinotate prediction) n=1 Tax=Henneguya salminicola TaxID=69463 RepID=A0A6G3MII2_HENSL
MVKPQHTKGYKHQNITEFKCNKYNTTPDQEIAFKTQKNNLCDKCKEIIEWKIKYGKYKPLSVSRRCNQCQEKTIHKAYCRICEKCAEQMKKCAKCETLNNCRID